MKNVFVLDLGTVVVLALFHSLHHRLSQLLKSTAWSYCLEVGVEQPFDCLAIQNRQAMLHWEVCWLDIEGQHGQ